MALAELTLTTYDTTWQKQGDLGHWKFTAKFHFSEIIFLLFGGTTNDMSIKYNYAMGFYDLVTKNEILREKKKLSQISRCQMQKRIFCTVLP